MTSDWEWVAEAARGDEVAWRRLIQQHYSRTYQVALLIAKSPQVAEDVAQESFVRVLKYAGTSNRGSLRALLSTIAARLAIRERRRESRFSDREPDEVHSPEPSALDRVLRCERDRVLVEIVGSLDDAHRQVLVLRFYGELSYEEIAENLQIPPGTVKSRIFYAVKKCREQMRDRGLIE